VLDARLVRLGDEARGMLAGTAVVGQEAPLSVWAAASGASEEQFIELVERAVEARVLDAPPTGASMRFVHALMREAIYEGLLPPDPDAVAYHLRQAGDRRACEWLVRAGDRAQRACAWRTAAERYETALALLAGDEARVGQMEERAWLLFHTARMRRYSDPHLSIQHLHEVERNALALEDPALSALAFFHRGLYRLWTGDAVRGLAEMQAGAATLEALSPAERVPAARRGYLNPAHDVLLSQSAVISTLAWAGICAQSAPGEFSFGDVYRRCLPGVGHSLYLSCL
jgi:hypothetical protein